jgi:hypothetical protein
MTPHPIPPPRKAQCPSPTALEAHVAGEPLGEVAALHVPECTGCNAYVQALRLEQEAFFVRRPVERFLEQSRERRRPMRWLWWLAPVSATLVAAVLIFNGPEPEPVVLKGRAFTVVSKRMGRPSPFPVLADQALRPGDSLRFSYRATRDGYVAVLNLDGRGQAHAFSPFDGAHAAPRAAGDDAFLPGAVELDDAAGDEWLIAVFDAQPFALEGLLQQLRATRPGETPRLRCGSCTTESLHVRKEP